jgi:hypothetical protein
MLIYKRGGGILDQNLSPLKVNKTWAYESKWKFQVS